LQTAAELVERIEQIIGTRDFSLRVDPGGEYDEWFVGTDRVVALAPTVASTDAPRQERSSANTERARRLCEERRWDEALAAFEESEPTEPDDLVELGQCLYMLGRDDDFVDAFGRAHEAYVERGRFEPAVRCAFWNGLTLSFRGEMPPAGAWFKRAARVLQRCPEDTVERGYLLLPRAHMAEAAGDLEEAVRLADDAARIGESHGNVELAATARHVQGRMELMRGDLESGLALLDEAMLAVTAGKLPPMMTGLVYCSVIAGCQKVLALGRSRRWTMALSAWCDAQPSLVAFTGRCLVHRAEVMRVSGEWDQALQEADMACQRLAVRPERGSAAEAWYERAEVHRLRGQFDQAEAAYHRASDLGRDPQPGLALLRTAQGETDRALAAIHRLRASTRPAERARVLAAAVEVALAAGRPDEATEASEELAELANAPGREVVAAMAAYARASVALSDDDPAQALQALNTARELWQEVGAPFELARCRWLKSCACAELGDIDGAELELRAARREFERLGAVLPESQ
jgi:tetratricopeptide (TPR) repeat protein